MSNNNEIIKNMQNHLDNLTKPIGSLGELEEIALKLAAVQNKIPPQISKRASLIFAADHGITEENVSMYPKEVTAQMVLNFLGGGAAINVLSKHCGSDVFIVDSGVDADFDDERVINKKVAKGTKNFLKENAMTENELAQCLAHGKELARMIKEKGYDLVSLGDMGIGNTSTAAAMLIAGGFASGDIIDRGTGIDDERLQHKIKVINDAIAQHNPGNNPMKIMQTLGGFEICTMTGLILELKGTGIVCVLDGFPVTAAGYMAYMMDDTVLDYCFAGHKSKVKGHQVVLDKMGLKPLIDLNMRLGEGTGAVIGGFLIDLSAKIAGEMASFASAGVSTSKDEEENY